VCALLLAQPAPAHDHTSASAPTTAPANAAATTKEELRGVWITNVDSTVLTSKQGIAEMMDFLADTGINIVYPVVWNKAVTLYPSYVMKQEFDVLMDPLYGERDPLQELIVEAHRVGIEVIPWFEYGFASSYNLGGGPLLEARPEWKAIDRDGKLAKKNNFEWMNSLDSDVQTFLLRLVLEVAAKYDVDGIQGDDRMPAMPTLAGYDPKTVAKYREEFGQDPPHNYKDETWVQWRADILTNWLARLRAAVKAIDSNLTVSMSPSYYDWSLFEYLQDSKTWVNRGLVDTVHPQAYRRDINAYKKIVDDLVTNQFDSDQMDVLYPGILMKSGPFVIPADYLLEAVKYNRENGINGEVWFFYEGLNARDRELAQALKAGPYAEKAALPNRNGFVRRPGGFISKVDPAKLSNDWYPVEGEEGHYMGTAGSASVSVDVPKAAHYGIYMHVGSQPAPNSAQQVRISWAEATREVTLDLANSINTGWVKLDSLPVAPSDNLTVEVVAGDQPVTVGPVMLLVNRRKSPDVVF
jgi:uncharacterized lipoprotein YddW (UPF0748 family)